MRVVASEGLGPVARFSLALGVILAVTAVAVAGTNTVLMGRYVEDETARFTRMAVDSHFGTVFDVDVFERALAPDEREQLAQFVVFHFSIYGIVATNFYDSSGKVVFSYDAADIGRGVQGESAALLGRTLEGETISIRRDIVGDMRFATPRMAAGAATAVTHGSYAHDASTPGGSPMVRRVQTLETWVPIRDGNTLLGATVVWRNVEPIDAALRQIQGVSGAVIALAALILWLVLRGVYVRSSERIMAQSTALATALDETERTYDTTLQALSNALDVRDSDTEGHARRVVHYMDLIADELSLPEDARAHLRRGALLHDIGKIGVPDHILRKPGPLTPAEWLTMRTHPAIGSGIIEDIPFLEDVARIVRAHHERWDGTGYPDGLTGTEIPLGARIFAVADSFDAMTSDRPYRRGRALQEALGEVLGGRGTQFDPTIADAFLRITRARLDSARAHAPTPLAPIARSA